MDPKTFAAIKIVWGIILLICSFPLFNYVTNTIVKGIVSCWCLLLTIRLVFSIYTFATTKQTSMSVTYN